MIELVATIIITASSALLFGYWFRYTCLLILSAKTSRDYAGEFAAANQLSFPEIQSVLRGDGARNLDLLHGALNRDYAVVTYLMSHVDQATGTASIETRMLAINYKLMGAWYSVSKSFSVTAAQRALDEMAMVVAHFANTIGERSMGAAATA